MNDFTAKVGEPNMFGLIQGAANAQRLHYQGVPNLVITEPHALQRETYLQLWQAGYRIIPFPHYGAAQSLQVDGSQVLLGQDKRRPQGYLEPQQ